MVTVEQALNEFIQAKNADGLAPASLKWYRKMLKEFATENAQKPVMSIVAQTIRAHMVARRERYSAASYADLSTALHAFFAWCTREYLLAFNPMQNIKRIKPPEPEPKAISPADFRAMFDATDPESDAGIRDRALLAALADTGARAGGLATLTRDRLNVDQGFAVVREKGNKTRRVVFTHYTGRLLYQWLWVSRHEQIAVFTSLTDGGALTYWGLYLAVKRLKQKAGVEGDAYPHAFRHGFGRAYLEAGGDLVTLSKLMGHSSPNTTAAFYAVFSAPEIAAFHEKRSPLLRYLGENA